MSMRRMLFALGVSLAVAAASTAQARSGCEAYAHHRKVTGTVIGALGGGLLGSAVAGHGSRGTGALVGAGLGAVVGNQMSRVSCDHRRYRSARYSRRRSTYAARRAYPQAPAYAGAYGTNSSASCHYVTRPYYDQAGRLVYAPMQVCE
jgi:uncharacterized protein YcfJ